MLAKSRIPAVLPAWIVAASMVVPPGGELVAQEAASPAVKQYAILIGIEEYHQPQLRLVFCLNDVEQMAAVLSGAGYQVWQFTERQEADRQPSRENLMAKLPALLRRLQPEDALLVYFTGHGFLGPDGKLYLAPVDCDASDPASTGLGVEWLRQELANCPSRFKLLVLDACHAGSDKGIEVPLGISATDLARPFERTPGLYVLASCQGEEKSLIWEAKRQSLFSYWLVQGLRGHADRDGDTKLTADELHQFVSFHVPRVAERVFRRPQHPDRVIGPGVSGDVAVLTVKPRSLRGLLADMAEQLATILQLEGVQVVGVPEFAVDAKKPELELGRDFGLLGRWCATELSGLLATHSGGQFRVVTSEALQEALQSRNVGVRALRTRSVRGLSVQENRVGALVLGVLRSRVGSRVTIQCELFDPESLSIMGTASGEAELSEHEWAMLGRSTAVASSDYRPDPRRPVGAGLIERLDQRAEQGHPMQDAAFPYRVYLVVGGQRRPGKFWQGDLYVPLRRGELYAIEIELGSEVQKPVLMRLLVDGLNTLPEPERRVRTRGIYVEPVGGPANQGATSPAGGIRYLPAQRVSLEEAQAWSLNPERSRIFIVRGFFTDVTTGAYREFRVVSPQELSAWRLQFSEELGLITAAFYEPKQVPPASPGVREEPPKFAVRAPSLATDHLGTERREKLEKYHQLVPGRLLAVIHLRYVDQNEWEQIPVQPVSLDSRPGSANVAPGGTSSSSPTSGRR
jgi:hypothetical protein